MRYTFKNSGVLNLGAPVNVIGHEEYSRRYHDAVPKALVKLGQLEDIEEELGIEFLKMKEISVIYVKTKDGLVYPMEEFGFDFRNKRIVGIITNHATLVSATVSAFFSDRGRTWALTKEKLK